MISVDAVGMKALNESQVGAASKDGQYFAMIEVFHQLHCLNMIRKYVWRDYYQHDATFHDEEHMIQMHIGECLIKSRNE